MKEEQELRDLWSKNPNLRKEIDNILKNRNCEEETSRRERLLTELDESLDKLLKS